MVVKKKKPGMSRAQTVVKFLLDQVEEHPDDLVAMATRHFGVTQQAIQKHLQNLIKSGQIKKQGRNRGTRYFSGKVQSRTIEQAVPILVQLNLSSDLEEDIVFKEYVAPLVNTLPRNVVAILAYGFTEMFNNILDHSKASKVDIGFRDSEDKIQMVLQDNGIGVFEKIFRAIKGTKNIYEAILHLVKGKFTTDPKRHSGEGLFFTSRIFDHFSMCANGLCYRRFAAADADDDWSVAPGIEKRGTRVFLEIDKKSQKKIADIFKKYTSAESMGFVKTEVPVILALNPDEMYLSRSQAKRLMLGLEKFEAVMLDFKNVESVGQAFCDEVFRVWAQAHPGTTLTHRNTSAEVQFMIERGLVVGLG